MRTKAYQRAIGRPSLDSFYMATFAALKEWEVNVRERLKDKSFSDSTIAMLYGAEEIPVAVATYSELLNRLPAIHGILLKSVIITAVSQFEAFVEDATAELVQTCTVPLVPKRSQALIEQGKRGFQREHKPGRFERNLMKLEHLASIEYSNAILYAHRSAVLEFVATRNLLIHNDGIVDQFYLTNFPTSALEMGRIRPLDSIYLNDSIRAVENFERFIDWNVQVRIAKEFGQAIPELDISQFRRPPKRGTPRRVCKCWCITTTENDSIGPTGIEGVAACWSRRGRLSNGVEVIFCEFEIEPEKRLPVDSTVLILPSLSTPVEEISTEIKERLVNSGLRWRMGVSLKDLLRERGILVRPGEDSIVPFGI